MVIPCLKSFERSAAASAANCRRRAFSSSETTYQSMVKSYKAKREGWNDGFWSHGQG